jgi:hypothetical protein
MKINLKLIRVTEYLIFLQLHCCLNEYHDKTKLCDSNTEQFCDSRRFLKDYLPWI